MTSVALDKTESSLEGRTLPSIDPHLSMSSAVLSEYFQSFGRTPFLL